MHRLHRSALGLVLLLVPVVHAQSKPVPLSFEVATIRPAKPGAVNGFIRPLPGGFGYVSENMSVKVMISLMYRIPMRQIKGGPEWLAADRYDIQAKADKSYSVDDLHAMFQNLLAERFNLKLHTETKEGNVYALSVDKAGLKMTPNTSEQNFAIPILPTPGFTSVGTRVPMPYLTWWLGQQLQFDERPVVDETGLTGNYDFTVKFAPVLPPDRARDSLPPEVQEMPSLFEALRLQLGRKLQPQRGPVTYLVIDGIDKPSEN